MIYLDNSATTNQKPKEVLENVTWAMNNSANPSRSGHKAALAMSAKIFEAREVLCKIINFNAPNRIVFTKNGTESLNLAIFGTARKGGHVITTENEHNSTLRPLFNLKDRGIIELTILPCLNGNININDLKNAIQENTYLVAINHVSNVTGGVNPIEKIGDFLKDKNILFLVDGAQSIGHIDVDFTNYHIDLLAAPCHKGLYSPMGVGFLAVAPNIEISPILCGGTGSFSEDLAQPKDIPDGLEAGTIPAVSILGALGGATYVKKHYSSIKKTFSQFRYMLYNSHLPKSVKVYSVPNNCGIFTFAIDGISSAEIANILDEKYQICTRSGIMCAPLIHKRLNTQKGGLVRASFSSFNTLQECKIFLQAITEIANSL